MFLQTKCVIWVKPKRSFRRGKRGESLCENGQWKSDSFTKGLCIQTKNRRLNTQSCWYRKKCPSVITLNPLNASQVTAFVLYYIPNKLGVLGTGTRVKTNVPFCYLQTIGIGLFWHLHYHNDITMHTFQTAFMLQGLSCVTTPEQMHTISAMTHISSLIIDLRVQDLNDVQKITLSGSRVCSSCVVYNTASHSMLTRCDDAILYPVSFWRVSPNVSNHEWYFSIKGL